MSGITRREPSPYVPAGPIDQSPVAFRPAERRPALAHVLRGVSLGAWDQRLIDWLVEWDDSTVRTVASLIERARLAERSRSAAAAPLTRRQREILGRALADALAYRKDRAGSYCAACEREFGGLCSDHYGDEIAADDYLALAGQLGIEVPAADG